MAQLMLFAGLREAAGRSRDQIQAATVGELIEQARIRYGESFGRLLEHSNVAVNGVLIEDLDGVSTLLAENDEVAVLPPVSGGSFPAAGRSGASHPANLVTLSLILAGLVATSLLGAPVLAGFAAVVSALGAATTFIRLAGAQNRPLIWITAGAAAVFPVAVLAKSENGLLWALALAVLVVGSRIVVSGAIEGCARAAGVSLWLSLYFGFTLSFAVLIRRTHGGVRLLAALAIMILLYKLAVIVVDAGSAKSRRIAATGLTRPVVSAGLAASVAGAVIGLAFLRSPFTLKPMVVLGVVAGLAALLGDSASSLISSDLRGGDAKPAGLPVLMSLDSLLLALPAFYYGFRLYVT